MTYIDKLKELGVFRQYCRNVRTLFDHLHQSGYTIMDWRDFVRFAATSSQSFRKFILGSFIMRETPEGREFWIKISKYQNND